MRRSSQGVAFALVAYVIWGGFPLYFSLLEPANAEMKQIAHDAKAMQTLLGEHQDSVVAAEFLARMSSADNVATGESVFTYGVLIANEPHRAAAIRASLRS